MFKRNFCWRNIQYFATQVFQNERTFRSAACDVPESAFCQHVVVLPVSADFVPALSAFSVTALRWVLLVYLPVMTAHLLHCEPLVSGGGASEPGYALCVVTVRLLETKMFPLACCYVSERHVDRYAQSL